MLVILLREQHQIPTCQFASGLADGDRDVLLIGQFDHLFPLIVGQLCAQGAVLHPFFLCGTSGGYTPHGKDGKTDLEQPYPKRYNK